MKIISDAPVPNKTEIKAKVKQEFKQIGSLRHRPGLKLFSFNYETGELKAAQIEVETTVGWLGQTKARQKVVIEKKLFLLRTAQS